LAKVTTGISVAKKVPTSSAHRINWLLISNER
jgi:predicted transcriptional regulator